MIINFEASSQLTLTERKNKEDAARGKLKRVSHYKETKMTLLCGIWFAFKCSCTQPNKYLWRERVNDSCKARQIDSRRRTFCQKRRTAHFPHYLCILFCLCGQNLNRNACVFLLFGVCLSTSVCILCVYVCVWVSENFYGVCVRAWQSATDVRAFIRFRGLFISFWSEAARPARKVWKAAESRFSYFSNSSLSSGG